MVVREGNRRRYGYATNTRVKFILVVENTTSQSRDTEMKMVGGTTGGSAQCVTLTPTVWGALYEIEHNLQILVLYYSCSRICMWHMQTCYATLFTLQDRKSLHGNCISIIVTISCIIILYTLCSTFNNAVSSIFQMSKGFTSKE